MVTGLAAHITQRDHPLASVSGCFVALELLVTDANCTIKRLAAWRVGVNKFTC